MAPLCCDETPWRVAKCRPAGANRPVRFAAMNEPTHDLLLLHGSNGSLAEVQPWVPLLSRHFRVHTLNLSGHGGREIPPQLSPAVFVADLLAQMDARGLHAPIVLGYSFSGVVALHLAAAHPQRVTAVITLGTRWVYDTRSIAHATHLLQEARLSNLPQRAEQLARTHHPNDWRVLARTLSQMYRQFAQARALPAEVLSRVACPCLVMTGTTDPIASVDETVALHRSLPRSTAATFDGSAHPPERVPMGDLQHALAQWVGGGRFSRPG